MVYLQHLRIILFLIISLLLFASSNDSLFSVHCSTLSLSQRPTSLKSPSSSSSSSSLPTTSSSSSSHTNNNNNNNSTLDTCVTCPAGRSSSGCHSSCPFAGQCPGLSSCAFCSPGTYNDKQGAPCLPCAPGFVSDRLGSLFCRPCPRGFAASDSAADCLACSPGSFNPTIAGGCQLCPAGSCMPNYAADSCTLCGAGTFANQTGSVLCSTCQPGFYNPQEGATNASACLLCPSGKYCPYLATHDPVPCPPGYYCLKGEVTPRQCPTLSTSRSGSSQCYLSDDFYIIIAVVCFLVVVGIIAVVFVIRQHRFRALRESVGYDYESRRNLIPEPLPGPVYGGY